MNFQEFKVNFQKQPVKEYPNHVPGNPIVSICVQTYNQVEFIEDCLKSILMQKTDFLFEILLGEDSSSDGTREICKAFADKNPDKIRLFLHERENNIKVGKSNTGLFNSLYNFYSARGKYIAYCDGDDYWDDPLKLQQQVSFLDNNPDYVLAYHQAIMVTREGKEIKETNFLDLTKKDFSSEELKKVLVQPVISTWCFRNKIQDIPIELTRTLNADNFWISLLGFHGEGKFLKKIKASHYRIHHEGIWSMIKKENQLSSKRKTYQNLSDFYSRSGERELSSFFRTRAENYSKMLVLFYLKKGSLSGTIKNIRFILRSRLSRQI